MKMTLFVKLIAALLILLTLWYDESHAADLVTGSTPETKQVHNVIGFSSNATKINSESGTVGQVHQNDSFNNILPVSAYNSNGESITSRNGKGSSETPVAINSLRADAIKPINQTKDIAHIIPVIVNDTHVDIGRNVNENGNKESEILAPAISTRSISNGISQRQDKNNILPIMNNNITIGIISINGENKANKSGTPVSVVSNTTTAKQVNQGEEHASLPITTIDSEKIGNPSGLTTGREATAAISIIENKLEKVNQSKDFSDIAPVITDIKSIESTEKPESANETSRGSGITNAAISVIDSVKAVNQSKDIKDILPIVTNVTKVDNERNMQQPVNQANDTNKLEPVVTNITKVKDVGNGGDTLVAVDNKVQPTDDIPFVDLNIKYDSIGTDYCSEKNRCNSTASSKTCSCDRLCGVIEDCCEDADIVRDVDLDSNQFTCTHLPGMPGYRKGMMFVSKCSPSWNDDVTQRLCEGVAAANDLFSLLPVSDRTESGFTYKNRHCAYCNYVYEYEFWRANVKCLDDKGFVNISDAENCEMSYQLPNKFSPFRQCDIHSSVISECPTSYIEDENKVKCVKGSYSIVFTDSGNLYRNKYCAVCNGVDIRNLYCESQRFTSIKTQAVVPPKIYSFRLIVDFNSQWEVQNGGFRKPFSTCKEDEIYDPFASTCREIFCPPSTKASEGKCVPDPKVTDIKLEAINETMLGSAENCTLIKITQDEFEYINGTSDIRFQNIIFNETEYHKNGSDIFTCLEKLNISFEDNISKISTLYHFDKVEGYVSLVGLVLSITASFITLCVYVLFPQLLNIPGKNVFCLIMSLIVAQVLFLVAAEGSKIQVACTVLAVAMHYFFLCAFCWMNVIAFDLWMTFSQKFVSPRFQLARSKRFYYYSLYAWCLPLVIVGIAIILDFSHFDRIDLDSFTPNYGEGVCWITSRNALLLFFAGPLALFKLFDFISFGFTAYHIAKARKQGAFARKGPSTSSFLINLRLSLVMGLTWAFAFVANFTDNIVVWYLFIIFNTLQGLFIALSFLCTRKVLRLFREKFTDISSHSSSTQMSIRPSYATSK